MRKILFLLACIILGGCTQKSLENNNTITINLDEDYQLQRDDVKIIALSKHKMYTIISNQNHLSSNLKHQMLDEIMLNEKDQWIQVSKKIKVNNKVTPIINFYLLVNKEKIGISKSVFM